MTPVTRSRRCRPAPLLAAVLSLSVGTSLTAQDLLGITWNGEAVLVNSYSGAVTPLASGLQGFNSLARATNGTFWSARRVTTTQCWWTTLDPNTGAATPVSFGSIDVRGLATGPGSTLYAVRDAPGADLLVSVTLPGGFTSTIGSTGFGGIQGLASHQGVLYAWDTSAGLLVVNPLTGVAVDPFPAVSGPVFLQSLCSHPDGRLLVGGGDSGGPDSIYSLDVTTGVATLIGPMTGAVDVRGLESLAGFTVPIGSGCDGVFGPVVHTVTGATQVGGTLTSMSTNHAPNAPGVVVFGASASSFLGLSLPVLLDPLFGTVNCRLYTSMDGTLLFATGPTGPAQLQFSFTVPPGVSGASLNLQHACLEPVAGGMSWSNGVALQIQ